MPSADAQTLEAMLINDDTQTVEHMPSEHDIHMNVETPLYFAALQEAWFEPHVVGADDALVQAGWHRIRWCTMEDWYGGEHWCDQWHPKLHLAAVFLFRILLHVPHRRILIIGDSTLTWDMQERGEHGFTYNWTIRDALLRAAGAPSSALWGVPGVALHGRRGLISQVRDGVRYGGKPDAVLMVGRWNERDASAEDMAKQLTQVIRETCDT